MRIISSGGQAALDSGLFKSRALLKLMPSGVAPLCLWDDRGNLPVGGDTFIGRPGRFTISPVGSSADFSVRNVDVTISGLDPEAIAMLEGAAWHQRPVLIQRALIAKDLPKIINVSAEFGGFMDTIEWGEVVEGKATLIIHCESSSREYARTGSRTASDADQRQRDPEDGFLSFAQSAVSTTINWGTSPQAPPKQKASGIAGFFQSLF